VSDWHADVYFYFVSCEICVFVVVTDLVDTEFYEPPIPSAQTDYCKECPGCCGLPIGQLGNTGIQSTTTQLIITFAVAALLSCLLLV